jgi:hypothetical protein
MMKKMSNLFNSPKAIIALAKKLFEKDNSLAKMSGKQFREELSEKYSDMIIGFSYKDLERLYLEIRYLKHIKLINTVIPSDCEAILQKSCKAIGKVYETTDLSIFKYMNDGAGNRSLKQEKSVMDMVNSFLKVGQMVPILINIYFEVLEGQHRLDAAKYLQAHGNNWAIKFIISDINKESEAQAIIEMGNGIKLFNVNDNVKTWTNDDNEVFIMITLLAEHLGVSTKKVLDFLEIPRKNTLDKYFTMEINTEDVIAKFNAVKSLVDEVKKVIIPKSDGVFSEGRYFRCFKQLIDICDLDRMRSAIHKNHVMLVPIGTNIQIHEGIWKMYNHKLTNNAINFQDYFIINKSSIRRKPV